MIFLLFSAVPLVYAQYGFSLGETGSIFITMMVGAFFGAFAARWQDHLYDRDGKRTPHGRAPPESRLYGACVSPLTFSTVGLTFNNQMYQAGGLIVPISLFWFAWSGRPGVHWMIPTVALVFFNFGS